MPTPERGIPLSAGIFFNFVDDGRVVFEIDQYDSLALMDCGRIRDFICHAFSTSPPFRLNEYRIAQAVA
jgi:hypothetical protein